MASVTCVTGVTLPNSWRSAEQTGSIESLSRIHPLVKNQGKGSLLDFCHLYIVCFAFSLGWVEGGSRKAVVRGHLSASRMLFAASRRLHRLCAAPSWVAGSATHRLWQFGDFRAASRQLDPSAAPPSTTRSAAATPTPCAATKNPFAAPSPPSMRGSAAVPSPILPWSLVRSFVPPAGWGACWSPSLQPPLGWMPNETAARRQWLMDTLARLDKTIVETTLTGGASDAPCRSGDASLSSACDDRLIAQSICRLVGRYVAAGGTTSRSTRLEMLFAPLLHVIHVWSAHVRHRSRDAEAASRAAQPCDEGSSVPIESPANTFDEDVGIRSDGTTEVLNTTLGWGSPSLPTGELTNEETPPVHMISTLVEAYVRQGIPRPLEHVLQLVLHWPLPAREDYDALYEYASLISAAVRAVPSPSSSAAAAEATTSATRDTTPTYPNGGVLTPAPSDRPPSAAILAVLLLLAVHPATAPALSDELMPFVARRLPAAASMEPGHLSDVTAAAQHLCPHHPPSEWKLLGEILHALNRHVVLSDPRTAAARLPLLQRLGRLISIECVGRGLPTTMIRPPQHYHLSSKSGTHQGKSGVELLHCLIDPQTRKETAATMLLLAPHVTSLAVTQTSAAPGWQQLLCEMSVLAKALWASTATLANGSLDEIPSYAALPLSQCQLLAPTVVMCGTRLLPADVFTFPADASLSQGDDDDVRAATVRSLQDVLSLLNVAPGSSADANPTTTVTRAAQAALLLRTFDAVTINLRVNSDVARSEDATSTLHALRIVVMHFLGVSQQALLATPSAGTHATMAVDPDSALIAIPAIGPCLSTLWFATCNGVGDNASLLSLGLRRLGSLLQTAWCNGHHQQLRGGAGRDTSRAPDDAPGVPKGESMVMETASWWLWLAMQCREYSSRVSVNKFLAARFTAEVAMCLKGCLSLVARQMTTAPLPDGGTAASAMSVHLTVTCIDTICSQFPTAGDDDGIDEILREAVQLLSVGLRPPVVTASMMAEAPSVSGDITTVEGGGTDACLNTIRNALMLANQVRASNPLPLSDLSVAALCRALSIPNPDHPGCYTFRPIGDATLASSFMAELNLRMVDRPFEDARAVASQGSWYGLLATHVAEQLLQQAKSPCDDLAWVLHWPADFENRHPHQVPTGSGSSSRRFPSWALHRRAPDALSGHRPRLRTGLLMRTPPTSRRVVSGSSAASALPEASVSPLPLPVVLRLLGRVFQCLTDRGAWPQRLLHPLIKWLDEHVSVTGYPDAYRETLKAASGHENEFKRALVATLTSKVLQLLSSAQGANMVETPEYAALLSVALSVATSVHHPSVKHLLHRCLARVPLPQLAQLQYNVSIRRGSDGGHASVHLETAVQKLTSNRLKKILHGEADLGDVLDTGSQFLVGHVLVWPPLSEVFVRKASRLARSFASAFDRPSVGGGRAAASHASSAVASPALLSVFAAAKLDPASLAALVRKCRSDGYGFNRLRVADASDQIVASAIEPSVAAFIHSRLPELATRKVTQILRHVLLTPAFTLRDVLPMVDHALASWAALPATTNGTPALPSSAVEADDNDDGPLPEENVPRSSPPALRHPPPRCGNKPTPPALSPTAAPVGAAHLALSRRARLWSSDTFATFSTIVASMQIRLFPGLVSAALFFSSTPRSQTECDTIRGRWSTASVLPAAMLRQLAPPDALVSSDAVDPLVSTSCGVAKEREALPSATLPQLDSSGALSKIVGTTALTTNSNGRRQNDHTASSSDAVLPALRACFDFLKAAELRDGLRTLATLQPTVVTRVRDGIVEGANAFAKLVELATSALSAPSLAGTGSSTPWLDAAPTNAETLAHAIIALAAFDSVSVAENLSPSSFGSSRRDGAIDTLCGTLARYLEAEQLRRASVLHVLSIRRLRATTTTVTESHAGSDDNASGGDRPSVYFFRKPLSAPVSFGTERMLHRVLENASPFVLASSNSAPTRDWQATTAFVPVSQTSASITGGLLDNVELLFKVSMAVTLAADRAATSCYVSSAVGMSHLIAVLGSDTEDGDDM